MNVDFADLAPHEEKVAVGRRTYILTEAAGDAAIRWRAAIVGATKQGVDGKVHFLPAISETEALLVSLCLYYPGDDGELRLTKEGDADPKYRVPIAVVKQLPNRIMKALFTRVKDVSDLSERPQTVEQVDEQIVQLQAMKEKLLAQQDPTGTTAGGSG